MTVVEKMLPNYTFFHKIPQKNNWGGGGGGGIGIYLHSSLSNIGI